MRHKNSEHTRAQERLRDRLGRRGLPTRKEDIAAWIEAGLIPDEILVALTL